MIERIAQHFAGRWRQGYVRGKLRSDPAYAAAFELLGDSARPVLDLGCGLGLLEFYLRERGFLAPLTGLDFDAEKIAEAQRIAAGHYPAVTFTVSDITELGCESGGAAELPLSKGHVVLFDLLHYLPADAQGRVLEHAADRVAPGALCLIRATLRDASWRFRITRLEESFLRFSRWMKTGAVTYPTAGEVLAPFRERRFSCEVRPLWGRTPFNSYLFVCRAPLPANHAG